MRSEIGYGEEKGNRRRSTLSAALFAGPEPLEKAWSKFKQFLRSAKARTAEALQTIAPDNAAAWFRHCGYGLQQL